MNKQYKRAIEVIKENIDIIQDSYIIVPWTKKLITDGICPTIDTKPHNHSHSMIIIVEKGLLT